MKPASVNPFAFNVMADAPSSEFLDQSDDNSDDDTSVLDETDSDYDDSDAFASSSEFVPAKPSPCKTNITTNETTLRHGSDPASAAQSTLRVPVAPKKPGGGIFISNAMRQFLARNHSDSDLPARTGKEDTIHSLLYRSESAEKLRSNDQSRMVIVHQDKPKARKSEASLLERPKDVLLELLRANGFSDVQPCSYKTLKGSFFLSVTPKMISSYDMALMTAVRNNDLGTLQNYYADGRNLQCCNRFHESILHTAARRGSTQVMDFLLHTAKLNLAVVCDSGRTPMHDACWTGRPNFTVVRWMLEACPDFLLIADNKNFTPLDYIPKEAHQEWCDFLRQHQELLKPRVIT